MTGSLLTTWGTLGLAIHAKFIDVKYLWFFIAVPVVTILCQLTRAILRQTTIGRLLKADLAKLKYTMAADILLFWLWSIMLWGLIVSTCFGRTIRWRGIRYKMLSPTETIVLRD